MAATIGYPAQLAQSVRVTNGRGPGSAERQRPARRNYAHRIGDAHRASHLILLHAGRVAYAALVICVLVTIITALIARPERPAPDSWTAVTVGDSGTLWALAQAHPVSGLTTAETVALIKRSNHLDSGLITPGQTLRVPAPDSAALAVVSR